MNLSEWRRLVESVHVQLSSFRASPERTLRQSLALLNQLALAAPDFVLSSYVQLSEAELHELADLKVDRILQGDISWQVPSEFAPLHIMRDLGAHIRAVDACLAEVADPVPPIDPQRRWKVEDPAAYVVPRPWRWLANMELEKRPYSRRGVLRHRILPATLADRTLRLVNAKSGLTTLIGQEITVGAAVFSNLGLSLDQDLSSRTFLVKEVEIEDGASVIRRQIAAAHQDQCFAAVWPELCMSDAEQQVLITELLQQQIHGDWTVAVLMAGSWHNVREDGHFVNASRVYDGFGNLLLTYEKRLPFTLNGLTERILPTEELPVLILDDVVIGFAICLDFCQRSIPNPYSDLDVDMMLVPSYGGPSTMDGHLQTARDMRVRFGTKTLVVQQAAGAPRSSGGYVLPPSPTLTDLTTSSISTTAEWQSFVSDTATKT